MSIKIVQHGGTGRGENYREFVISSASDVANLPTSVRNAVPPGRMRPSAVCTWVCVPITAVTFPSSAQATAAFSLVASA